MKNWQRLTWIPFAVLFAVVVGCNSGGGGGIGPDDVDTTDTSGTTDSTRILIPEGYFIRGYSDGESYPASYPARTIYISEFEISPTEVTNNQFCEFLNDGNDEYVEPEMMIESYDGQYVPMQNYEDHPVVYVTWSGAMAYAEWAGGRLPTEAEWEKAARGTEGQTYPWGNNFAANMADIGRNNESSTIEVGSYPEGVSPYGCYDMAGSVWEWTYDWFYRGYYSLSPDTDPMGPDGPVEYAVKTIRGGGYRETDYAAFATWYRYWAIPEEGFDDVGFRVAWPSNDTTTLSE